ncbi:lytic murein transglycosylase [Mesorhizobium sp. B3-2-1]|nr:lytic murein transglycosylase [Mesorhizobium sp. B3-2-1]
MRGAPLWPAGHLPLKGGDWLAFLPSPFTDLTGPAHPPRLVISPLEGEMPGRAEGGAWRLLTRLLL